LLILCDFLMGSGWTISSFWPITASGCSTYDAVSISTYGFNIQSSCTPCCWLEKQWSLFSMCMCVFRIVCTIEDVVVWLKIWWMENIVAKNIKDLFQIYFVLKIYLWTINIFLYRMMDDLMQIYFEREYYVFDSNILSLKEREKKTYLQCDIRFKFLSYISL